MNKYVIKILTGAVKAEETIQRIISSAVKYVPKNNLTENIAVKRSNLAENIIIIENPVYKLYHKCI